MALFKIFKGNETAKLTDSTATGYRTPTDGYAYYDTSSKLFYIDAAYGSDINDITRAPINANIANIAMNGVYYGTCSTAQATKTKVATLVNGDGFKLATGVMVAIKFTYASAASTMTLNVNSTGAKNLVQYGTTAMSSTTSTNGWPANAVVPFVYDGTRWVRFYWSNSTYYYTSAYSDTSAGTAEKAGKSSAAQTLTGSRYFEFQLLNDNTVSGAITLNMNSLGAKAIYINGEPSSSSNHTLPKGCYLVYYDADGDNGNGCYHFRTDNQLSGNLAGNAATATYATTAGTANSVAWANVDGAPGEASTTAAGLMSAADKTKLNGIATGAEVNQNAFSKVAVSGQNTVEADSKTDTLTLAGSNVTLTTNATSDTVTIGITSANVTAALGYTPPQQDTTYSAATQSAAGLMSADDKTKLDGVATGAEVNQNAFSNIKVGSTTVAADAKTDTVEFVGSNIGIAGDATNDKVTFSLTSANVTTALGYTPPQQDTTYSNATTSAAGLMSSDDKTKLNGIAAGAEVNQNAFGKVKVGSTTVEADAKIDTLELVGSNVTITTDTTNDKVTFSLTSSNVTTALGYTPPQQDTTYSAATTSTAGLMSSDDKTKLNGIETGAQVNKLESVTASGTAPLTLNAGTITNKSIAISGSIADASTSAKGVVKIGDGINVSNGTISVTAASVGLSSAMLFKGSLGTNGTITDLPAASADNQGYTYKVITANTYANTSGPAKVGDVFVSDGSQWVLIPSGDEPNGTVTSIATGSGLTGGPITSTGTISHSNSVTAQTTQAIYPIKIDACGHISAYGSEVTSLPASDVYAWAKASTKPSYTASEVGLGNVSNNTNLNSTTGAKGDIIYWSAANTPAHLTIASSTTKKFLSVTSQAPSWVTLTNSDVGLGNVENKSSATIRGELTSSNVTTALGFTPYDSTNPNNYTAVQIVRW